MLSRLHGRLERRRRLEIRAQRLAGRARLGAAAEVLAEVFERRSLALVGLRVEIEGRAAQDRAAEGRMRAPAAEAGTSTSFDARRRDGGARGEAWSGHREAIAEAAL